MTKIQNPILPGFNADPSFCRGVDENGSDVYYIANSTFEWFPGVQIHRSYDLVNWELVCRPLDTIELLDMKGDPDSGGIWAPDLSYSDGLYWLVYTDVKVTEGSYKDCTNYLTTAPSVFGPWSAPVQLTNSGFDASLFHDDTGKKYLVNMYWDSREYMHPFAGIQCTEYSVEQKRLLTETSRIIYKGTNVKLVEGPHIYKLTTHAGKFYYLFAAQGGTTYMHQEIVARSAELDGVFETQPGSFEGEPFLTAFDKPFNYLQKCGHGSLAEVGGEISGDTTKNRWYFAHLTGRPLKNETQSEIDPRGYCPLGRETAIQLVEWDLEGWPHIVGGKWGARKVEAPKLQVPSKVPSAHQGIRGNYKLPLDFQTLRIPFTSKIGVYEARNLVAADYSHQGVSKYSVNANSDEMGSFGRLTLFGRESLSSAHTQAHIARRWTSFKFTAEVFVDFNPTTWQQQAGLTAYYNTRHWNFLNITNAGSSLPYNGPSAEGIAEGESKRVLEITKTDRGAQTSVLGSEDVQVPIPWEVRRVGMRLVEDFNCYSFSYSFDEGKTWTQIGPKFKSIELSDDYTLETYGGFFTGAFVGLAAVDGTGMRIPAYFADFSYLEK
jgi:xylan 1,4-beta-xylosidase